MIETAIINCNQISNARKLKFINSEFQLEQLIRSYKRVATTDNENDDIAIRKTLIDHFSSTKSKCILKADTRETGMVNHYMAYGIRKINAVRINSFKKQKHTERLQLEKVQQSIVPARLARD